MSRWIFLGGKANQNEDIPSYAEWVEVPYIYSVANLTELAGLTGAVIGQKVRVESVGRSFEFTAPGVSPVQDAVVINGVGGQWHSLEGTSDQKWLSQTDWYVDGINGNDESNGSELNPLQTISEIQRRWDTDPIIQQVVTIRVISVPSDGQFYLRWRRASENIHVDVIDESPRTQLAAGVLASYTPFSIAANDCIIVEVTGIDFTALQDKRINFGAQGVARVVQANPNGSGVSFARITQPYIRNSDWRNIPTTGVPVIGQTVTVEELGIAFNTGIIDIIGGFSVSTATPFGRPFGSIFGFQFLKSFTFRGGGETAAFNALRLVDTDARDIYAVKAALGQFGGSYSARGIGIVNSVLIGVLLSRGPDGIGITSLAMESSSTGGSSKLVFRGTSMIVYIYANISETAFFDGPANGSLQIHNGGMVYSVLGIVGKNNAIGIMMSGVSRLVASGGVAQLAITGIQKITIPGGALTSVTDLPRKFDRGGGEIALIGGTRQVTIPALPTDTIVSCTRKTLGGVSGVNLTYSITGNVITFLSDSATDTSTITYYWFSPSTRAGLISN